MRRKTLLFSACAMTLALLGCSGPAKHKPAELSPITTLLSVKKVWSASIGDVGFPLEMKVVGSNIYVASSAGTLSSIEVDTGSVQWAVELGARISAGVGADGEKTAVTTTDGELVVLRKGKRIWQQKLSSVALTPPLLAGGRVFVMTPDRTLIAFDGETGKRLWQQQRGADSLVLDRAGVLFPAGDTLVAGIGGRLVGLNPLTGAQRWDIPISVSRGTNEVDRLVDLMPGISRIGADVCLRAYQNAVACVNLSNQKVTWSKVASGFTGIAGDDRFVFGTEADGRLISWRRKDGEVAWQSAAMKWRQLGTPLLLGETLAVPDAEGLLHLLSKIDGAPLGRLLLDGSPLGASPVLAGKTLVVVTQKGSIFAFRPE
nr:outer membrane protein assembly factor BamB [uncultured Rhodoferax sp.]